MALSLLSLETQPITATAQAQSPTAIKQFIPMARVALQMDQKQLVTSF